MGRAWRIEYEGALYHVMSRGNEGKDIYFDDDDRHMFLDVVEHSSERFEIDVFAYVLMGNHYHLLIRTNRANLSKAMQWLGVTYTRRVNDKHNRSGHLFQGRFKSIIVQNDAYLMQLSCYIHRNPLRAGVVRRLAGYRWSSYRAYAYGKRRSQWLSTEFILSQFNDPDRHKAYREKVQHYAKEESRLWEDFRHGMILGSKRFVEKIRKSYMPQAVDRELPQQKSLSRQIDVVPLLNKAAKILSCDLKRLQGASRISAQDKTNRDLLIYVIWETGLLTNTEIGSLFGLTYSSVSHSVKAVRLNMQENRQLRDRLSRINSLFKI
ncbi:MAG: transposase [Desulfobacterales bacterium]|jgi:REP element-mobilizing transposase RayT